MTAAPAGLRSYRKGKGHDALPLPQQKQQQVNPAIERLLAKLDKGNISATERKILHTLQAQTASQAEAASKTKAAVNKALQPGQAQPLTSAQIQARFKCRAHAAEIAAAQARTVYIPEGPPAEEEEGQGAKDGRWPKRQRTDGMGTSRSHDFWDSYFRHTKPKVRTRHRLVDNDEDLEEDEDIENGWGFCSSDSDYEGSFYDEWESAGAYGADQQQHPETFYKQAPASLSPAAAFQQLVQLVRTLPSRAKDNKAAAHLKDFDSKKVATKADLASAARQVWLAVHPDKNHSPAASEASQTLNSLLDKFKTKGAM